MKATGLEGLERLHRLILGVLVSAMLLLASLAIAAVIGISLLIAGFMSSERLADSATLHSKSLAVTSSGDLTNHGTLPAYERFNDALDEIKQFNVPVLMAPGNHDTRRHFRQLILNESSTDEAEPYVYSRVIDGLRVIVLDSRVPGAVHGYIDDHQLAWLDRTLSSQPSLAGLPSPATSHVPADFQESLPERPSEACRGSIGLQDSRHLKPSPSLQPAWPLWQHSLCYHRERCSNLRSKYGDTARLWSGSSFSLCRIQGGQLSVRRFVLPGKQLNRSSRSTQMTAFS